MSASKWKPYPEYKQTNDTWLATIPMHWDMKPLQFIFQEKKNLNSGGKVKNVLSLSYGKIIRKDISQNTGLLPSSFETYNIVEANSIILRLTDLQNDKKSLRVGLAKEKGIITSAYLCIKSADFIMNKYGYLLLHALDLDKVFYAIGSGVRQSMGYSQLKKLNIAIPTKNEQERIIEFCEKIESSIQKTIDLMGKKADNGIIRLLDEYRRTLVLFAVTGKIDVRESV